MQSIKSFFTILVILLVLSSQANAAWLFKRTVTIDFHKVPADQTQFPIVVYGTLSYLSVGGGKITSSTGKDIIFTSDPGCTTKLNFEIASYNSSTGAVEYWINTPLSSTVNSKIYLCYGN